MKKITALEKLTALVAVGGLAGFSLTMPAAAVSLDGEWKLDYRLEEEGGVWKTVSATVPGDTYLAL